MIAPRTQGPWSRKMASNAKIVTRTLLIDEALRQAAGVFGYGMQS
jgi:hypothetical protein